MPPIASEDALATALSAGHIAQLLEHFNTGRFTLKAAQAEFNIHTLTEQLRKSGAHSSRLRRFDRGAYADIYRLRSSSPKQVALKVAGLSESDAFSGASAESFLLRYLFRQFVLTGLTPHLPITLSSARSVARGEVINICEYADYRSLWEFLPQATGNAVYLGNVVRLVLFQIGYTLAWIQKLHPNFRHNDVSLRNILIAKAPSEGFSCYRAPDGATFYLPNYGLRAILWDFDLASAVGFADNSRVYRFELEDPSYGISSVADAGQDLFHLANWIYGRLHKQPAFAETGLPEQMISVWGKSALHSRLIVSGDKFHRPPHAAGMPAPLAVLASALFTDYRAVPPGPVTHTFGSSALSMPLLEMEDAIEMLRISPLDLPENYCCTVPLGFGAPNDVQALLLSLPSARIYLHLYEATSERVSAQLMPAYGTPEFQTQASLLSKFASDLLRQFEFPAGQLAEKLGAAVQAFMRVSEFLKRYEQRYAKLLMLLALFFEGAMLETSDFISDICDYTADSHSPGDINSSAMQYKWVCLLLERNPTEASQTAFPWHGKSDVFN